jgi:hypothetical protein
MPSAFAQTVTGTIQGTVTAGQANTKLAGVAVSAVAPSGRYSATTDQNGFFTIQGVSPDTYSVTFTRTGYETFTLQGVTVQQGQISNVSSSLNQSLTRIGRTQARSTAGAFQPTQTTDQYNVGATQITTALGKSTGSTEADLLAQIPGASFDSSGYPVLRGGREYEEGFQYEGIDYTDAFTHQFTNSLIINGAQNFQVQPGAGDASVGNAGTGAINVVAKRGTQPAFGLLEGDIYSGIYDHEVHGEYGWASPNGRFSNYSSIYADRTGFYNTGSGQDPISIGRFFGGTKYEWDQDVLNNFFYKWGKDNNQSFQFYYQNTSLYTHQGLGFVSGTVPYKDADQYFLYNTSAITGLAVNQVQATMPFTLGQHSLTDTVGGAGRTGFNYNQPAETFKLQYSVNLNPTTFLTAKMYRVNAVALFDIPFNGNNLTFGDQVSLQGGQRVGFAIDGTKQLGSKNVLGFGGKYDWLRPVYSQPSATTAMYAFTGPTGAGYEVADFLPNDANCPLGPGACGYLLGNNPTGTNYAVARSLGNCYANAPGSGNPFTATAPCPVAAQLPYSDESTSTNRQDFALYVKDTYSPTDRLKIDLGLRMDGVNWRYPTCTVDWCFPTSVGFLASGAPDPTKDAFNYDQDTRTPRVLQPRAAVAWQATRNDAFRVSYGRSVQFPAIAQVDVSGSRAAYQMYNNVPSFNSYANLLSGGALPGAATVCGTTGDRTCTSYADQLYWENQNGILGIPIQPLKPETFNNWDFSFSHQFPHQVSAKITPFYNKAFNSVAATQLPLVKNGVVETDAFGNPLLGPTVNTNLGKSQTTGVEFLLTKEAAYGLSGSLSLTYQNEFSNVIPTSASEDFFPSIPPASLALGNLYRVGFLSPFVGTLALQERTHSGWRINPVFYYNHGYPIGSGLLTATDVNSKPYNVPNTNLTNPAQLGGTPTAPQYVDPRNPGTFFNPNIAASRGNPESSSAGGYLSKARIAPVNLTIEYTSPRNTRSTFGVVVGNLFNQYYLQPALNGRYQPVATGIAGPYSGYSSYALYPNLVGGAPGVLEQGRYNFTNFHGNQAYLLEPIATPRNIDFYYQLHL